MVNEEHANEVTCGGPKEAGISAPPPKRNRTWVFSPDRAGTHTVSLGGESEKTGLTVSTHPSPGLDYFRCAVKYHINIGGNAALLQLLCNKQCFKYVCIIGQLCHLLQRWNSLYHDCYEPLASCFCVHRGCGIEIRHFICLRLPHFCLWRKKKIRFFVILSPHKSNSVHSITEATLQFSRQMSAELWTNHQVLLNHISPTMFVLIQYFLKPLSRTSSVCPVLWLHG